MSDPLNMTCRECGGQRGEHDKSPIGAPEEWWFECGTCHCVRRVNAPERSLAAHARLLAALVRESEGKA